MGAVTDLLARAQSLFGQAKTILLKPDATAEELAQAESLKKEAEGLKARAAQLKEIEMEADLLQKQQEQQAENKGNQPPAPDFKSWSEFVVALTDAFVSKGKTVDRRLKFWEETDEDAPARPTGRKDMSGITGADGGVLIPLQQLNQIMAVAAPMSVVRQRATIINMSGRTIKLPVLDQTVTAAGEPSFFGGVKVYWEEEAATITASDMQFKQSNLVAHELVGYTAVANSLLRDAGVALADFLGGPLGFPGAVAWAEDYAFLRGNGVGKPLGVLESPAAVVVPRNTLSDIKYDDLIAMEGAYMGGEGVWLATHAAKKKLLAMNGPTATNYAGVYMWGSAKDGVPNMLLGRPIVFVDKLPAVGEKGDMMLCDFTFYPIGNRQNATTVEADTSEKFGKNQTAFRIVSRVAGQPWLSAPITLAGDATTKVSPFVVLKKETS